MSVSPNPNPTLPKSRVPSRVFVFDLTQFSVDRDCFLASKSINRKYISMHAHLERNFQNLTVKLTYPLQPFLKLVVLHKRSPFSSAESPKTLGTQSIFSVL